MNTNTSISKPIKRNRKKETKPRNRSGNRPNNPVYRAKAITLDKLYSEISHIVNDTALDLEDQAIRKDALFELFDALQDKPRLSLQHLRNIAKMITLTYDIALASKSDASKDKAKSKG
jgi:hypothetical protein